MGRPDQVQTRIIISLNYRDFLCRKPVQDKTQNIFTTTLRTGCYVDKYDLGFSEVSLFL